MGLFNVMICAPMLIFAFTMRFMYEPLLGGDPRNLLRLSGVLMLCAAIAVWRVREAEPAPVAAPA